MKTLKLIIKQTYFDQILSGEKDKEYREIKPTTWKKYIATDADGNEVLDENGNSVLIKYDALQLYVGYNKDRDSALVEVTDAYAEYILDEDGELIAAYENTDENGEPIYWYLAQVTYCLGKVLESNVKPKNK